MYVNDIDSHYGTKVQKVFEATIQVDFHASQKNSKRVFFNKRTNKSFIGSNSRVKKAQDLLLLELRSRANAHGLIGPIKGRMLAMLVFGFKNFYTKQGLENRKLGDCSNLVQIVEDQLQKAEIIEDDFFLAPLVIDRVPTEENQVHIELWIVNDQRS